MIAIGLCLILFATSIKSELESDIEVVTPESLTARFGTNSFVTKMVQKSHNGSDVRSLESFIVLSNSTYRDRIIMLGKILSTTALSGLWFLLFSKASRKKSAATHHGNSKLSSALDFGGSREPNPTVLLAPPPVGKRIRGPGESIIQGATALPAKASGDLTMPPNFSEGKPSPRFAPELRPIPLDKGNARKTSHGNLNYFATLPRSIFRNFSALWRLQIPIGESKWNVFERLVTHGFIYYSIISLIVNKIFTPNYYELSSYKALVNHMNQGKTIELPNDLFLKELIWITWISHELIAQEEQIAIIVMMKNALKSLSINKKSYTFLTFTNGEFFSKQEGEVCE